MGFKTFWKSKRTIFFLTNVSFLCEMDGSLLIYEINNIAMESCQCTKNDHLYVNPVISFIIITFQTANPTGRA